VCHRDKSKELGKKEKLDRKEKRAQKFIRNRAERLAETKGPRLTTVCKFLCMLENFYECVKISMRVLKLLLKCMLLKSVMKKV
jgi:hypothetical protein